MGFPEKRIQSKIKGIKVTCSELAFYFFLLKLTEPMAAPRLKKKKKKKSSVTQNEYHRGNTATLTTIST
jgi:hypothetical protein